MARYRVATIKQIQDADATLQKVCEYEVFTLTVQERAAIMEARKALKVIAELRKEGK